VAFYVITHFPKGQGWSLTVLMCITNVLEYLAASSDRMKAEDEVA